MSNVFHRFKTKREARENAQRIIRNYENRPGEPITGQDAEDVMAMLCNHPDAEAKIGPGIDFHFVGPNDRFGSGFRAKRLDGTEIAWSYGKAIKGTPEDPRSELQRTLRDEVIDSIRIQRDRYLAEHGPACHVSGRPVDTTNADAHHCNPWPFRLIVEAFLDEEGLIPEDVKTEPAGIGVRRLVDRMLAARWVAFHDARAVIVMVSKQAHHELSAAETRRRAAKVRGDNDN